jgi:hypothetical protein
LQDAALSPVSTGPFSSAAILAPMRSLLPIRKGADDGNNRHPSPLDKLVG